MGTCSIGSAALTVLVGIPVDGAKRLAPHLPGANSPVRSGSLEAGTFESSFFLAPTKGSSDRMLRAARRAHDAGKRLLREHRSGARTLTYSERLLTQLTASAVRIYEELTTLARLNRGRVYPSYDRLADVTGLGRSSIRRGLAALEALGFLVRQRRFRRALRAGPGPRRVQTSNAYRLLLPKTVLRYLPRVAPIPQDIAWRREQEERDHDRVVSGLGCQDFAALMVDGEIGRALRRLGAALDYSRSGESEKLRRDPTSAAAEQGRGSF